MNRIRISPEHADIALRQDIARHVAESLGSSFKLSGVELDGELDFEEDEQISVLIALLVEGKTLVAHGLDLVRLDDLAGVVFNAKFRAV